MQPIGIQHNDSEPKLLLVNCQLIKPKGQRGMGTYALNLLLEIVKQRPQYQFILATDRKSSCDYLRSEFAVFQNVTFIYFALPGVVFEQFVLPVIAISYGCHSIVHSGDTASVPCLWLRARNILILHDVYFKTKVQHELSFKRFLGRLYRRVTIDLSIRRADLIATVSEYAKSQIHEAYPCSKNKRSVITYNGSGLRTPDPGPIEKRPRLLLVSGSDPQKNLKFFLEVLRQHESFMAALEQVDVVGVDSAEDIGMCGHEKINFVGYKKGEELSAMYYRARIVAVPSLCESFGIPALEALYHGCDVLASNTGALSEVLGDRGVYFSPNSRESIIQALSVALPLLAESRVLAKMPEHTSNFNWKKSASVFLSEISGVME